MIDGPRFLQHVIEGIDGITTFVERQLADHRVKEQRLAAMKDAIETVVNASEPRLRLVGDYAEKLLDVVESASRYCQNALRQAPPALTLDSRAWAKDPRVNAFFATVDDLRTVLSNAAAVQDFFKKTGRSECFAWMEMVKRETVAFGTMLEGRMLVREAQQIEVNFSEHRLYFPAASEADLRQELHQQMLQFLAIQARKHLTELQTRRDMLEEQRRQLRAQLDALREGAPVRPALLSSADPEERHLALLEKRLVQTELDLAEARKPLNTLDDYLEQVRLVLSEPANILQLHIVAMRLSRLGIKLDEDSPELGATISLLELRLPEQQRIGALVRIPREECLPDPIL